MVAAGSGAVGSDGTLESVFRAALDVSIGDCGAKATIDVRAQPYAPSGERVWWSLPCVYKLVNCDQPKNWGE